MEVAVAAIAGIVVGFVTGLIAYRSSRRWCASFGGSLSRVDYAGPTFRRNAPDRRF